MPPTFMESEALLMTLRNLMRNAYDKEKNPAAAPVAASDGNGEVAAKSATAPPAAASAASKKTAKPQATEGKVKDPSVELKKLASLRAAGILTDEEFENAKRRLLTGAAKQ